ncbi:MAG TPA: MFS transporter, partial [Atribacteraceae bacterium]|nr:MFS transporter [Atribacteraceae bacterium]
MSRRLFEFSAGMSHGVNDIYWFILPSILPAILEQFRLGYGMAGGMLATFLGTIALFSIVFGRCSDRIARWKLIGYGFLAVSAGMVLTGMAGSFPVFLALILVTAVGISTYHPTIYAAIDESTVHRRGKTYGKFEFWGTFGISVMFFSYGTLLKVLDWRGLFFISALPALFAGIFYLRNRGGIVGDPSGKTNEDPGPVPSRTPFLVSALFFLGVTVRVLSIAAVVNFVPTYLVREVGLEVWTANYGSAFIFLGGMLFVPIAGILADRWKPLPVLQVLAAATGPVIFLIGSFQSLWILIPILVFFGGCWLGVMPSQSMMLSLLNSATGKGQAFGLLMGLMTITNALGPGFFGLVADRIGL